MKKRILMFALALLFVNCNSNKAKEPDNLISEDKMVDILYDLYLVNSIKTNNNTYLRENKITPANYVYQKYKIDSLQFVQSDNYYASDIEEYEKLYRRVTTRLERSKATIDTLIAKNPPEVIKVDEVKKNRETQFRLRDSLRNKRLLLNKLAKDTARK